MSNSSTPFWKYIVAILILWVTPLLIAPLITIVLQLLNYVVPEIYERGLTASIIFADALAIYISCHYADKLLDEEHRVFCFVNTVILALIDAFAIYAALSTPKDEREAFFGSIVFLVSRIIACVLFIKNR